MLADDLKTLLATSYAFVIKAQNFHWNVEGSDFAQYHNFFQGIYDEVHGNAIDQTAEYIRTLDVYTPGSFERFSELSVIVGQTKIPRAMLMIQELLDDNNAIQSILTLSFQRQDVQEFNQNKKPFDVLWCYDVLQYLTNPYQALANWWHVASQDAMMIIAVPQTTNVEFNMLEYNAQMNHKHHFTMPMLIYMLAVNGWDCKSGFFKKGIGDPWMYAIVYRSNVEPMDPAITNLYNLAEDTELLPESAVKSIHKYGMLRQRDLLLPWLDKSNMWMEQQ